MYITLEITSKFSLFSGPPDHTVRLQSLLRNDIHAKRASTPNYLPKRCQIHRNAIAARFHVQRRGERRPELSADVPQNGGELTGKTEKNYNSSRIYKFDNILYSFI